MGLGVADVDDEQHRATIMLGADAAPKLYVRPGSHPCAAVERALELKGDRLRARRAAAARAAAIRRAAVRRRDRAGHAHRDGEQLVGLAARSCAASTSSCPSRALLPADPAARARVLEAERWGDEVLQPIARRILSPALSGAPAARWRATPRARKLPLPAPRPAAHGAPPLTRAAMRARTGPPTTPCAPTCARCPATSTASTAGSPTGCSAASRPRTPPTCRSAPTVRLLMTIGDVRPLIDGRPARTARACALP